MSNTDTIVIETEQLAKSNAKRIDALEEDLKDVKNDQKAIYKIATSVEVIAQRVSHIEEKVDDTNRKVDAQAAALSATEQHFYDKVNEVENVPYKNKMDELKSIKIALITAAGSAIVTAIISTIIAVIR